MTENVNYEICKSCKYIEKGELCSECRHHICINCTLHGCNWCEKNYSDKCSSCPICNPHVRLCTGETMCKAWVNNIVNKGDYLWCIKHDSLIPTLEPLMNDCEMVWRRGPLDQNRYVKY